MNPLIFNIAILIPIVLLLLSSFPFYPIKVQNLNYRLIRFSLFAALFTGSISTGWMYLGDVSDTNIINSHYILNLRLDKLSLTIYTMIAIIALVVIKFSKNYLEGNPRQHKFFSQMAFTISMVLLFVVSGHLILIAITWISTSLGLQKLLKFNSERKKARIAARKKFIIARIGDLSLISAFLLIYLELDTAYLSEIINSVGNYNSSSLPFNLKTAGVLLAISAGLKSVQIPSHVWLLDVMESPTPVSALLHAGLLNAGPFLIIRFSYLMEISVYGSLILVIIGGFSALFGSLSASTQPSVKNALAYSSIAHMGFTLFICGLGVYSAALLHLVAHSFYKAHAFLSSGSMIESIQFKNALNTPKRNNQISITLGLFVSAILFCISAYIWQISYNTEFQILLISGVIFLGVAALQINSWNKFHHAQSVVRLSVLTLLVINAFFMLEDLFAVHLSYQIPTINTPDPAIMIAGCTILFLFTLVVLFRSWLSDSLNNPFTKNLEIHFRNGLYFNHLLNRVMNTNKINNYK